MSDTSDGRDLLSEHNAAVVWRVVGEIWNRGDLELADSLFAPSYVNHYGLISDLVRGPEAIKVSVALYRAAFPNLWITVHNLIVQGETVALRWTARNAESDERTAIAPNTTRGTLTGTTFCRLVGEKIAESWTSWDSADVLRRLGVLPPERGADDGNVP